MNQAFLQNIASSTSQALTAVIVALTANVASAQTAISPTSQRTPSGETVCIETLQEKLTMHDQPLKTKRQGNLWTEPCQTKQIQNSFFRQTQGLMRMRFRAPHWSPGSQNPDCRHLHHYHRGGLQAGLLWDRGRAGVL